MPHKPLAVSILCVSGPYTSVNCTLTLLKSSIRKDSLVGEDAYARAGAEDDRFSDNYGSLQSIVTSTGQNDSGLFETNLRDERFLPFELSGVISQWQLELPADVRQFDYDTISDVILHLRYTAREGGGLLRNGAVANLNDQIAEAQSAGSDRLFSVRHEFPTEWARFKGVQLRDPKHPSAPESAALTLAFREEHYPFWSKGRLEAVKRVDMIARTSKSSVDVAEDADGSVKLGTLVKDASLGNLRAGRLTNNHLKRPDGKLTTQPTAELTLFLNDNSTNDLWLAVAWGKLDESQNNFLSKIGLSGRL